MPDDSFVLKYFKFLKSYLAVGPPVYFVLNNTNLKYGFTTIYRRIMGIGLWKLAKGFFSHFICKTILLFLKFLKIRSRFFLSS